ncbi:DMT family transporter [Micromonospora sp. CPCC 206060]|uniref:DMT family transporter n=1 Tax=Micromonospora sp. CPCC 206060 TaxID=3122406 RepID=UPI002FEF22DD
MTRFDPRGVLLCTIGMVIVGSSISISQLILDYPPLTGQAVRYALAAAGLAAIARWWPRLDPTGAAPPTDTDTGTGTGTTVAARSRPTGRELGLLTLLAATGLAGFNACVLIALRHSEPAMVGTVIGAAPLGLALLAPLLHGGRPAPRLLLSAGIVVTGTALVQGAGRTDAIGLLAAFGALGGEIAFSLLAAIVLPRLGAVRVAAYGCGLAVPLLLVAAVVAGEPARLRLPTAVEAATLVYLAGLMTVVAFVAWFLGLRRLGLARAGMLVGLMPVATLVTAAVQAGHPPGAVQATGVLVVAAGLAVGLTTARDTRNQGLRPASAARTSSA